MTRLEKNWRSLFFRVQPISVLPTHKYTRQNIDSLVVEVSFLFAFAGLTSTEKETSAMVETHFHTNALHDLGRHCLKRMSNNMVADCDSSPLCLAHFSLHNM